MLLPLLKYTKPYLMILCKPTLYKSLNLFWPKTTPFFTITGKMMLLYVPLVLKLGWTKFNMLDNLNLDKLNLKPGLPLKKKLKKLLDMLKKAPI